MTPINTKTSKIKPFIGFSPLNYTQVPDEFFDTVAPTLSEAQLKVMLYIIRRTFGFKKQSDRISLRQMLHGIITKSGERLDQGVGVQKKALLKALNSLEKSGYILRSRNKSTERGNEATSYSLNIANLAPLGVQKTPSPRGSKDTIQETVEQETDKKENSKKKKKEKFFHSEAEVTSVQSENANYPKRQLESSRDSGNAGRGFKKVSELLQNSSQKHPVYSTLEITSNKAETHLKELEPLQSDQSIVPRRKHSQMDSKNPKTSNVLQRLTIMAKEISREFAGSAKEEKIIAQMHRIYHIVQKRGMDEATFFDVVMTVRSLMRQERMYVKNQIAYFFIMLKDRLQVSVHSPP